MAIDNVVTLIGNLTRDPDLKFTPNGTAVADMGIAWNRKRKEGEDEAHFFDVVVWSEQAENVAASLKKGDRVQVFGRLDFQSWEADDGGKRTKVRIVADDVSPSLRWATVPGVEKASRDGGGSGGGSDRGGRDRSERGGRGGGRDDRGGSRGRSDDYSEEPF